MSIHFRKLISQLHLATKTYQFEKVSENINHLLRLSKMTEKSLGETISPADTLDANAFWSKVLDTRKVSDTVTHKSARSIYAVIWSAANSIPSHAVRIQAGEYCDHVATACEHYLAVSTADVKQFPLPTKKTSAALHVVGGTDA